MKIVIAGAGEVGTHLAKMLSRENHDIILIDEDDNKLRPMEENYDIMVAEGLSTSIYDLKEAGIENCDLFIAVTPIESQNITSCILAHNARRRDDNVPCIDAHFLCKYCTGLLRYLNAVGVTGIGVSAIAYHRLRVSVGNIRLRYQQRRALYEILRIGSRRSSLHLAINKRQIALRLVFTDTAMYSVCGKALCGTHAALNLCNHKLFLF